MLFLLYFLVLLTNKMMVLAADMDTVYQWKYVDYIWDSEFDRQKAIDTGVYNYTQFLPMDVDRAPDGRVFVAFHGMKGMPAALGIVTDQMGPSGPLIKPYPDWSYFKQNDCDSIRNVLRIAIDNCERLWVLDIGFVTNMPLICEPQLLAFDLKTDNLIKRIKIPFDIAKGQSDITLLSTPIVETHGEQCEDTTVYMADALSYGLIIWNNGNLSRLENPLFEPSEEAMNVTSGNVTVKWNAGLVGIDITKELYPGEEKLLYMHSLVSFDLYSASTKELKRSINGSDVHFVAAKNVLKSHAIAMAFSAEGTLFMGQTEDSAVACWNRYKKLTSSNIKNVAQDEQRLQYLNGIKVKPIPNSDDEELLVLSNRYVAFDAEKLNFNEYNYHILSGPVKTLIAGTVCETPKNNIDKLKNSLEFIDQN